VSAQTYITPTLLAILAHTTFHVLYDEVANGLVDVANSQYPCSRADNFIAVFLPFCIGKKESLAKHLNLHWGNPATVFVGRQSPLLAGAYRPCVSQCNKRAQSAGLSRLFFRTPACVGKNRIKTGVQALLYQGLDAHLCIVLSRSPGGVTTKNVTGSPRQ
jgi:hypothetical protein